MCSTACDMCECMMQPQVPFIGWLSVASPVQRVFDFLSVPTAGLLFRRTGRQFFLADADESQQGTRVAGEAGCTQCRWQDVRIHPHGCQMRSGPVLRTCDNTACSLRSPSPPDCSLILLRCRRSGRPATARAHDPRRALTGGALLFCPQLLCVQDSVRQHW